MWEAIAPTEGAFSQGRLIRTGAYSQRANGHLREPKERTSCGDDQAHKPADQHDRQGQQHIFGAQRDVLEAQHPEG